MHTDASATDIGLSLYQIQEWRERAIAYGGRDLSPSETNYSPTEREALAIVSDSRKFRNNLYGNKFTIHTDHTYALKWRLMSIKDPMQQSSRLRVTLTAAV